MTSPLLRPGLATAALVAWAACGTGHGAEPLYYEVDGETVVFTNQRTDATRPLPGFRPSAAGVAGAALPRTVFDPYIEIVAVEQDVSPELIKAVALVESGFDPRAVSRAGAQGLMQLMPQTAAEYGVKDAFDPLSNLRAGARHLRGLLDRFDGDLTLALAAYNAGEGAVRRHNGVPHYAETIDYVRKVHEKLGREPRGLPAGGRGSRGRLQRPVRFKVLSDGTILLTN